MISSFIFAFSIILAQTLAELGIYDEADGAFQWSGWGSSALGNASAVEWAAEAEALTDEEPVTIPAPLVVGVCVW